MFFMTRVILSDTYVTPTEHLDWNLHYEVCSGFWEVAKDEIINGGTVEKAGAETEVPV